MSIICPIVCVNDFFKYRNKFGTSSGTASEYILHSFQLHYHKKSPQPFLRYGSLLYNTKRT